MSQLKVIVVEDDVALGDLFVEILSDADFQCELLRDGAGAFERIREMLPDLVLLDMHLPHVSGVEILNKIRGEIALKTTKVIAVTADARLAESIENLVDITFLKPISLGQMMDLIARVTQPGSKV